MSPEPGQSFHQKATMATAGSTNVDSEWHLGNVFAKLGITSRKDLR